MALAKDPRWQCLRVGEQATSRGLRLVLQHQVRTGVTSITVRPGMPLADHPASDVLTVQLDSGQSAPKIVMAARCDGHRAVRNPVGQRCARGPAAGLADLRRINAINPDLDRLAALARLDPERVSIGDVSDFSTPSSYRIGTRSY